MCLQVKIKALKQTIMLLLSGESLPRVIMSVIRFCSNTEDHQLKKLMMLYWEVRCTKLHRITSVSTLSMKALWRCR